MLVEKQVHTFSIHALVHNQKLLISAVVLFVTRVAGNSAYIIGTLAESELGCMRILSLAHGSSQESKRILPDLTRMLTFDDSESVMNAAGTMGTLVSETCIGM